MTEKEINTIHSVLTDTEAETSVDFDNEADDLQNNCKLTFSETAFNFTIQPISKYSREFQSTESRIREETKKWNQLFRNTLDDFKKAKEKQPIVDWSILPEKKRAFLELEHDLTKVLRSLQESRGVLLKFIDYEYPAMLHLQKNVVDVCKQRINIAKDNKLEEILSNNENI